VRARRWRSISIRTRCSACRANAQLNGVELELSTTLTGSYDVLLAGDVLYELGNRDLLLEAIERGCTVLVSDPLRTGNPRLRVPERARYAVTTLPDVDYPLSQAVVYHLERGVPVNLPLPLPMPS
jgi:predicted nicotinamide N-methyase